MSTTHCQSTIRYPNLDHFIGIISLWCFSYFMWPPISILPDLGLFFSQQYTIYHRYNMKLQWYWTIHFVQNQPNLCWVNLSKAHINPSLTPWSPFNVFHYRLLKPWFQNIYGSNLPDSLYTILHIRYPTVYP